MSGVLGLIVGLVIGFMGANNINKSAYDRQPAATDSTSAAGSNPALPKDHPPIGTSSGEQSGPRPEVAAAIEKAKSQPQDFEAQMTAADLYYQIQRFEEAATFYETAVKLKPAAAEPMIKAGNAHFDAEKYEQAEGWYVQALQKEPKNIIVRTDLGLTFFLRSPRDVERAIKEYKTSLNIDPDHEITLQNLAVAYDEKNDRENFLSTLEKLKKINPKNPVVTKNGGN
ncbi:MAG: tetratricopeptide repeat protein [Pyrinomonadaceae bacterium]